MIAKRFHEQQATTNKQPTTNHNPFNKILELATKRCLYMQAGGEAWLKVPGPYQTRGTAKEGVASGRGGVPEDLHAPAARPIPYCKPASVPTDRETSRRTGSKLLLPGALPRRQLCLSSPDQSPLADFCKRTTSAISAQRRQGLLSSIFVQRRLSPPQFSISLVPSEGLTPY